MTNITVYSGDPDLSTVANAGYSTHLRGMIAGFREAGADVTPLIMGDIRLATVECQGDQPSLNRRVITRVRDIVPDPIWRVLRDLRQIRADRNNRSALARIVQEAETDLIYERYAPFHIAGLTVGSDLDTQVVLEINSPLEERTAFGRNSWLEPVLRRRLRRCVCEASLLVFVSTALRDHYEEKYGDALAPSMVVPNATNSPNLTDAVQHGARELTSEADTTYLIFVGSMMRWHRVDVLLEAMKMAADQKEHLHLLIVGDGELRADYEAMASRLGLDGKVTFTGAVERELVAALLARSSIALMVASNWWGSPVKLFEYAEAGCAIIAPDTAPVREIFEPGTEVMLTDGCPTSVAESIVRLTDDPALSKSIGEAATARVRADHTWKHAAERILEALGRFSD